MTQIPKHGGFYAASDYAPGVATGKAWFEYFRTANEAELARVATGGVVIQWSCGSYSIYRLQVQI